jgi:hypothetical protein
MTNEYENILRKIISIVLGIDDDTDFGVTPDRIEKWKEKREIEYKKYAGIIIENRIIYYSDFYDLETIVAKKWEKLKPILLDKKKFEVFHKEVEKFRNTIAHGRELYSYQQKLLEGIVQDLKTTFILYHNKNMNADDYFIRVLKVTDSLGSIHDATDHFYRSTNKILRVGDKIEFYIEAYDPKGNEIKYSASIDHTASTNRTTIESTQPKIEITITKEMVGKFKSFTLTAKTDETEYENSDYAQLGYTILP